MFKKIVLGLMIVTLSLGLFPILPASAKKADNPVSTTCEALTVTLEDYAATVPATPGQPYIAPTYKTITTPSVPQVTHNEYKYQATKQSGGGSPTIYATLNGGTHANINNAAWLLSAPSAVSNYSAWVQIASQVVIDFAGVPEITTQVIDNPGQPYIAPTPEMTNSVVVDIDGSNVANTTFSTSYANTFTYSDKYVAHVYNVVVTAWDGSGNLNVSGSSVPCDNLDHLIDICHANNGIKDYVKQNVDFDSIIKNNGHSEHQDERDIIPPFDYIKNGVPGHFDGLNWGPEGQAIYNANCVVTPDKPADVVDIDVEESAINCDTGLVTITTTTTTTGTELVDNEWVETTPEVEIAVTYRQGTTEELASCISEQPKDTVEVTTKESVDCDTKLVMIITTTTTTSTELVGNDWVPTAPVTSEETTYRDATTEELANCPVTETPKDEDGDVLGDGATIELLPNTSGNTPLTMVTIISAVSLFLILASALVRNALVRR
jgi:hypothetical protein